MAKVIIVGYTIKVFDEVNKRYEPLKNFGGNNSNLEKELFDFLNNRQGSTKIEKHGQMRTIFYGDLGNYNKIQDIIKCKAYVGSYGDRYDIVDVSQRKIDYSLKEDDSYGFPLNFLFKIEDLNSKTPDTGIIVFEKYKNHGAKGLFQEQFSKYLKQKFPDYTIEIEPIVPEEVINYIRNGNFKETILRSHQIPSDIANSFESGEDIRRKAKVELKITNLGIKRKLKDMILDKMTKNKLSELSSIISGNLIPSEEISFLIELNGNEKRILIKEEGETMTPGIDVTGQVRDKEGTSVNFGRLFQVQYKYLLEIEEKLNSGK